MHSYTIFPYCYRTAAADYVLRGNGPTAYGYDVGLDDQRTANDIELEGSRQSGRVISRVPSTDAGVSPSRKANACNAAIPVAALHRATSEGSKRTGAVASWAASAGHAGSRSIRCRSAQRRQLVSPGTTSGPIVARAESTPTSRCGMPSS